MRAISEAIKLGLPEVTIFYDYMGIQMWADGSWKRNKSGTIAYYNFIQKSRDKIKINFVKVKAHSNVALNDKVDALAKKAVGI
jgi:ribonuclease HI